MIRRPADSDPVTIRSRSASRAAAPQYSGAATPSRRRPFEAAATLRRRNAFKATTLQGGGNTPVPKRLQGGDPSRRRQHSGAATAKAGQELLPARPFSALPELRSPPHDPDVTGRRSRIPDRHTPLPDRRPQPVPARLPRPINQHAAPTNYRSRDSSFESVTSGRIFRSWPSIRARDSSGERSG